jgi:hypothetical protein
LAKPIEEKMKDQPNEADSKTTSKTILPRSISWYCSRILFTMILVMGVKQSSQTYSTYLARSEVRERIADVEKTNPTLKQDFLANSTSNSPEQGMRSGLLNFKKEMIQYELALTDDIQSQLSFICLLVLVSLVYSEGMEQSHQARFPKSKTSPK